MHPQASDMAAMALLFLVALGIAAFTSCAMGCSPANARRAAHAAEVAQYGAALEECYLTSTTFETYENCAQAADRKFGVKP